MSNKSFQYSFSKEEIIKKTEEAIADYEDEIRILTSVKRVYKKDGTPFQNFFKNFESEECTITDSRYDGKWIELHYTSRGKYQHLTLYLNDRDPEAAWENIQTTILNKQNNLKQQKALLDEINDPESVCGQFVDNLVKIREIYRKMGSHKTDNNKTDNSTESALYYALYDYLG